MPGYIATSQVSVQLTGTSSVPNNFTVDIYRWDVATDAAVYDRTIITGLTRTATSAVNGGTLLNGYGISGITGLDNYVKLTSTTSCGTTNTELIRDVALTVYQPSSGTFTNIYNGYPTTAQVNTFNQTGTGYTYNGFSESNGKIVGNYVVGTFDTLSYIDATGFTLSYVSGTSGGVTVYGDYQYGPFSSFSITKSGKTFTLTGSANTSLDSDPVSIKGTMRLTHNSTTNYVDFDYWYIPAAV
jgi:hypothetical protein